MGMEDYLPPGNGVSYRLNQILNKLLRTVATLNQLLKYCKRSNSKHLPATKLSNGNTPLQNLALGDE